MINLKIGKKVKCIKVGVMYANLKGYPSLQLNAIYIVNEIIACTCGEVFIDVGIPTKEGYGKGSLCYCGKKVSDNGIHYCNIKRFIIAEEQEEENKTEYKVVEIDKSLKEKREEVIFNN